MKYRIIRTHVETAVFDGIEVESPEEAILFAKENLEDDDFEPIEQSAYEYTAVKEDQLQ